MSTSRIIRSVAVLGNYGNLNLGDEATLATIIELLRQRWPEVQVHALSEDPEDTQRRHGIAASRSDRPDESSRASQEPLQQTEGHRATRGERLRAATKARLQRLPLIYRALRTLLHLPRDVRGEAREIRFLWACFRLLKRIDLLIIGGGGQFSDHFVGMWGFPVQLFKWCILARAAGAEVVVLNVGAGPISSRGSRWLFKAVLSLATYHSFRDERSKRLIEQIGPRGVPQVGPDLVFAWRPQRQPTLGPTAHAERTVGLNVFPYLDGRYWPVDDQAAYGAYLRTIARFASGLLEHGYRVVLFPTQLRADSRVIRDVMGAIKEKASAEAQGRLGVATIATVEDLAAEISTMDLVVATRFHALILAFLMGKPVLALCNEFKMADLMADMGQSAYALWLRELDEGALTTRFLLLQSNLADVRAQVLEKTAERRRSLEFQCADLFDELSARPFDSSVRRAGLPR